MRSYKFMLELFQKCPGLIIQSVFWQLGVGALGACTLFSVTPIIDLFLHPDIQNVSSLTLKIVNLFAQWGIPAKAEFWVGIFLGFLILTSLIQIVARYALYKVIYAILSDVMIGTFKIFMGARWYFFSSSEQGVLLNTFGREMTMVGNALSSMSLFFSSLFRLVFFLIVPLYISWQVTMISFFVCAIFMIPFLFLGKLSYQWGQQNTTSANRVTSTIQEGLGLIKLIFGFGNQQKSSEKLDDAWQKVCQITVKSQTLNAAIPVLYRPLGILMALVAYSSAKKMGIPISELTVLLLALFQFALTAGELMRNKNAIDNFLPSYDQIKKLRSRAIELKQENGGKVFDAFNKSIEVRNLTFAYPGHDHVLNNINMTVPKGSFCAIVGKSGAGKSTLIDMLMGFHDSISGEILIDGTALKEYDIDSYRHRIGYVPQDSVLFNMSIKDNLLWANEKATEDDIRKVCQLAYLDEFISKFPQGINTIVGDRGVRLSGGQVQRVALARAIIRKPELLILDEATSSLDTNSERLIQQAIENIAGETTIIAIAHRLSTIKKADIIYVLDEGHVVEKGSYDDLLGSSTYFRSMIQLQELGVNL